MLGRQVDLGQMLTRPQLDCLARVAQHKSSKEIALELGLSSHAIDARIKRILVNLGVSTRQEAARIFLHATQVTYQPLVCEPSDVAPAAAVEDEEASPQGDPSDDRSIAMLHAPVLASAHLQSGWSIAVPFRTAAKPVNDLPWNARLAWMMIILVGTVISVTLLISMVEGLSRLL